MALWDSAKQWPARAWGWATQQGRALVNAATADVLVANWPPEGDIARLLAYERNADLYIGNHEGVFVDSGDFKFSYDTGREYVIVNLLGALTDLLVNRLFGEGVAVLAPEDDVGTQAFFDHLHARNSLGRYHLEAGISASYGGDAVYKVRYSADEARIVIETVPSATWFPQTSPQDSRTIEKTLLAQVVWSEAGDTYLWQEGHEVRDGAGYITNEFYPVGGNLEGGKLHVDFLAGSADLETLPEFGPLQDEAKTGVDAVLVVHVPNRTSPATGFFGIPDYTGLETIQGELNHRYTQRAEVQDKFVDPVMYGPPLDDETGAVRPTENKYLVMPEDGTAPAGYLTWDAKLESVLEALNELRLDFAATSGIDLQALRPSEGSGVASGRALKLMNMRTQSVVRGKQAQFGPGLQDVYSLATKLYNSSEVGELAWSPDEGEVNILEPEDITIRWQDGLPSLAIEEIEEQALMLTSGIQSQLRAAQQIHGLGEEDAEALLERISGERQAAAAPSPGAFSLGPAFETIEPEVEGEGEAGA